MQLILKPFSPPGLEEIIVNDNLFAIGRHEEPFSDYDPLLVEKLSRRHARIFEQDNAVYIADLGSLNGTTVNDETVEKLPIRLNRGDEVCFAGLCFKLEILGATAGSTFDVPPPSPVQLILLPVKRQLGLEPVVVTRFPFLVNKNSEVFSRYQDRLADQITYISRRHAHLFIRDGRLFIEDLGSTNGTFVGNQRLDEHARQLNNGDVIAFGGDSFVYRVELVFGDDEKTGSGVDTLGQATSQERGIEDVTRTTFVTSADTFLDIFCVESDRADSNDEPGGPPGNAGDTATGGEGRAIRNPTYARWDSVFREVKGLLGSERGGKSRLKAVVLVMMVIVAVFLGVYMSDASRRGIQEAMDDGRYAETVVAANAYLEGHADDREIDDIATEALLKVTVPDWIALVKGGNFPEALTVIGEGRSMAGDNVYRLELMESMQWVTQLEQFVVERGGADASFEMFEQEQPVIELLDWWESDDKGHRRLLAAISQHVPEFGELRASVFSHLRTLRSQRSLDISVIDKLVAHTTEALRSGNTDDLQDEFTEFSDRYPGIDGVDKLHHDLDRYLEIDADIRERQWLRAVDKADAADFETPPFTQQLEYLRESVLPTGDIIARYRQARDAWRAGEFDRSIALLEALQKERWGDLASRWLSVNRERMEDLRQLDLARGKPGFANRLLEFHSKLDPAQDAWLVNTIADEFRMHRDKAIDRARQSFGEGQASWNTYQDDGGIRGLHRLQSDVSAEYRNLAGLLSRSWERVSGSMRIYESLEAEPPKEWVDLNARIAREIHLQRRSLAELSMVLEPSLKKAKLELLPEISSGESSRE